MVPPAPGQGSRDRYLDLAFDLIGALFVATATRLSPVPGMLREGMMVERPRDDLGDRRTPQGHPPPLEASCVDGRPVTIRNGREAHHCELTRVILPQQNRKQVEVGLGHDLRSAVAVDYVAQIDELVLRPVPEANDAAAAITTADRVS